MRRSELTRGAAPPRAEPDGEAAADEAVAEFVADALSDATPRSATLALLRFDEYLGLLRRSGLDVCPSGVLAEALRAELNRICRADGALARGSQPPIQSDGG